MTNAQRVIKTKLRFLNYAKEIGNVSKECRYFGVSRETLRDQKRGYVDSTHHVEYGGRDGS